MPCWLAHLLSSYHSPLLESNVKAGIAWWPVHHAKQTHDHIVHEHDYCKALNIYGAIHRVDLDHASCNVNIEVQMSAKDGLIKSVSD